MPKPFCFGESEKRENFYEENSTTKNEKLLRFAVTKTRKNKKNNNFRNIFPHNKKKSIQQE